jgi:hypothetical protein
LRQAYDYWQDQPGSYDTRTCVRRTTPLRERVARRSITSLEKPPRPQLPARAFPIFRRAPSKQRVAWPPTNGDQDDRAHYDSQSVPSLRGRIIQDRHGTVPYSHQSETLVQRPPTHTPPRGTARSSRNAAAPVTTDERHERLEVVRPGVCFIVSWGYAASTPDGHRLGDSPERLNERSVTQRLQSCTRLPPHIMHRPRWQRLRKQETFIFGGRRQPALSTTRDRP